MLRWGLQRHAGGAATVAEEIPERQRGLCAHIARGPHFVVPMHPVSIRCGHRPPGRGHEPFRRIVRQGGIRHHAEPGLVHEAGHEESHQGRVGLRGERGTAVDRALQQDVARPGLSQVARRDHIETARRGLLPQLAGRSVRALRPMRQERRGSPPPGARMHAVT